MANFNSKRRATGKKFKLAFAGWEEKLEELDRLSHHGILEGTKEALEETYDVVTPKIRNAMKKHHLTGDTERSIVPKQLEVSGTVVSIPIGFDIDNGGLPSIWLMYGTPTIQPDKELYQAIFGHSTSSEVAHVQYQAIKRTIEKYMG